MSLIELENIFFSYPGESETVLKDLSFSAERGELIAVRGDNGSGKTTLFRILNGLAFPSSGSYTYDGTPITEKYLKKSANSKLFHKRVGYLFQDPDVMLFNGRVFDEVAFGPRQMGLPEDEVRERVRDCMELFGIGDMADKAPYHLSGGQKKRVALAAVLSLNPETLILDEPFAGLDKKTRLMLEALLSELKAAGKTIMAATHEDAFFDTNADRMLEIGNEE